MINTIIRNKFLILMTISIFSIMESGIDCNQENIDKEKFVKFFRNFKSHKDDIIIHDDSIINKDKYRIIFRYSIFYNKFMKHFVDTCEACCSKNFIESNKYKELYQILVDFFKNNIYKVSIKEKENQLFKINDIIECRDKEDSNIRYQGTYYKCNYEELKIKIESRRDINNLLQSGNEEKPLPSTCINNPAELLKIISPIIELMDQMKVFSIKTTEESTTLESSTNLPIKNNSVSKSGTDEPIKTEQIPNIIGNQEAQIPNIIGNKEKLETNESNKKTPVIFTILVYVSIFFTTSTCVILLCYSIIRIIKYFNIRKYRDFNNRIPAIYNNNYYYIQ